MEIRFTTPDVTVTPYLISQMMILIQISWACCFGGQAWQRSITTPRASGLRCSRSYRLSRNNSYQWILRTVKVMQSWIKFESSMHMHSHMFMVISEILKQIKKNHWSARTVIHFLLQFGPVATGSFQFSSVQFKLYYVYQFVGVCVFIPFLNRARTHPRSFKFCRIILGG